MSEVILCPLVLGTLMGFLYHRRAGYEIDGDDPVELADVALQGGAEALVVTAGAEYYHGPLVVRQSLGANAIASLLGAATFVAATAAAPIAGHGWSPLGEYMAANGAGRTLLQGIIGLALPIGLLLRLTHGWLRTRGRSSWRDYGVEGIVGPVVFGTLLALTGMNAFALVYLLQLLAPSLVAMLAYRSLAGLEPAPLPADIEVADRRTLVGADHPRRRMARVIAR